MNIHVSAYRLKYNCCLNKMDWLKNVFSISVSNKYLIRNDWLHMTNRPQPISKKCGAWLKLGSWDSQLAVGLRSTHLQHAIRCQRGVAWNASLSSDANAVPHVHIQVCWSRQATSLLTCSYTVACALAGARCRWVDFVSTVFQAFSPLGY